MNPNSSNPKAGGCFLVCFGLFWLVIVMLIGFGFVRREGVAATNGSPFFGGFILLVFVGVGVGVIVSGVRMARPASPPVAMPAEELPLEPGNRVVLGSLTYTPLPQGAELRPSLWTSLVFLLFFGGFTLVCGYFAVSMITAPFIVLSGGDLPGMTINGMPASKAGPELLWGSALLGLVLPGGLATLTGSGVVCLLRFWCHPTVFDYGEDVFRCGGREVCRLSDIREILLRRITDPNYPGKAKVGVAVALRDGSLHRLEPSTWLRRVGDRAGDTFTEFGELPEDLQQQVRRVAAEIAARIGVPLEEREERGSLAPQRTGK